MQSGLPAPEKHEAAAKVADLLQDIGHDVRRIAIDEIDLARGKLSTFLEQLILKAAGAIVGACVALLGLLMLCFAAVAALEPVIDSLAVRLLIMAARLSARRRRRGLHVREAPAGEPRPGCRSRREEGIDALMSEEETQKDLDAAQADLELKVGQLKELLTEKVEAVTKPVEWLAENAWLILIAAGAVMVLMSASYAVTSSTRPSSAIAISRIRNFWTLPVTVVGNESTSFQ